MSTDPQLARELVRRNLASVSAERRELIRTYCETALNVLDEDHPARLKVADTIRMLDDFDAAAEAGSPGSPVAPGANDTAGSACLPATDTRQFVIDTAAVLTGEADSDDC